MSGIYGLFFRDGRPAPLHALAGMRGAMPHWARHGNDTWCDGPVGLGQVLSVEMPGQMDRGVFRVEAEHDVAFAAAGRVDNRAELLDALQKSTANTPSGDPAPSAGRRNAATSDVDLLRRAYLCWGEACVERIYGDWSFAAWHPAERRLFLARDHYGNTALYYHAGPKVFAFAPSRQALLALGLAPVEMDELYLAQVLTSWPAYHGERTIHRPLRRLPPAHCLTVTPGRLETRRYWRLEDTPTLHLRGREDYVEAFREVFDEAVRARLRTPETDSDTPIGVTLSGGLDSGAVAATAAGFLRESGRHLPAFVSVPLSDTGPYTRAAIGNELSLARATAQFAGNVDVRPVAAADVSPIQAIRCVLRVAPEPAHAAGNYFWLWDLERMAHACGCRVLLTGQMGNGGISWAGRPSSQSLLFQLHHQGLRRWTTARLRQAMPQKIRRAHRRYRAERQQWWRSSAIHPDFARRLDLLERRLDDPDEAPRRAPLEERYHLLKPGRSSVGSIHAEFGAAHGLSVRDPTADARVLAFTVSVPDHVFIDPATGLNRWLIRAAMDGRLPDEVRLNRRRGQQAGDLVPRLRASADEVEAALAELARGPATAYLDVPYMREVWTMVQTQDTPEAFRKAITILTRGIMAGLWVNDFCA